jgi:hypothetical protein
LKRYVFEVVTSLFCLTPPPPPFVTFLLDPPPPRAVTYFLIAPHLNLLCYLVSALDYVNIFINRKDTTYSSSALLHLEINVTWQQTNKFIHQMISLVLLKCLTERSCIFEKAVITFLPFVHWWMTFSPSQKGCFMDGPQNKSRGHN